MYDVCLLIVWQVQSVPSSAKDQMFGKAKIERLYFTIKFDRLFRYKNCSKINSISQYTFNNIVNTDKNYIIFNIFILIAIVKFLFIKSIILYINIHRIGCLL